MQYMRVNHRCLHIFVTQQFLHGPDIVPLREQMRRKAVPKGMTTDVFGSLCRTTDLAHGPLQTTLTDVMPADGGGARVSGQPVRGEHGLPNPESAGTRVFAFQGKRYLY
jgi:hypothetical protein